MRNQNVRSIALVGVMAAMIFVATMYIKIEIPSPTGMTMLKTGNILCLLAGLLLGKVRGGLASGIGSAMFDLMHPAYIASTPYTFVFFFLMAFVAGLVFENLKSNSSICVAVSCFFGAFTYFVLYITKSITTTVLAGSAFTPAVIANSTKMITSGFNAIVAVTFATILYKSFAEKIKNILN